MQQTKELVVSSPIDARFYLQALRELIQNKLLLEEYTQFGIHKDCIHIYDEELRKLIPTLSAESPSCTITLTEIGRFKVSPFQLTLNIVEDNQVVFSSTNYDDHITEHKESSDEELKENGKTDAEYRTERIKSFAKILQKFDLSYLSDLEIDTLQKSPSFLQQKKDDDKKQAKTSSEQIPHVPATPPRLAESFLLKPRRKSSLRMLLFDRRSQSAPSIPTSNLKLSDIITSPESFSHSNKLLGRILLFHAQTNINALRYFCYSPEAVKLRDYKLYDEPERDALLTAMNFHGEIDKFLTQDRETIAGFLQLFLPDERESTHDRLKKYVKNKKVRPDTKEEEDNFELVDMYFNAAQFVLSESFQDPFFCFYAFTSFRNLVSENTIRILNNLLGIITSEEVIRDFELIFISLLQLQNSQFDLRLLTNRNFIAILAEHKSNPLWAVLRSQLIERVRNAFLPENLPTTTEEKGAYRLDKSLINRTISRLAEMEECTCLCEWEVRDLGIRKPERDRAAAKVCWQSLHDHNINIVVHAMSPFIPFLLTQITNLHTTFKLTVIGQLTKWKTDGCNPDHYRLDQLPIELCYFSPRKQQSYLTKGEIRRYKRNLKFMRPFYHQILSNPTINVGRDNGGFIKASNIAKTLLGVQSDKKQQNALGRLLSTQIVQCVHEVLQGREPPMTFCYTDSMYRVTSQDALQLCIREDHTERLLKLLQVLGKRIFDKQSDSGFNESKIKEIVGSWTNQKIAESKQKAHHVKLRQSIVELLKLKLNQFIPKEHIPTLIENNCSSLTLALKFAQSLVTQYDQHFEIDADTTIMPVQQDTEEAFYIGNVNISQLIHTFITNVKAWLDSLLCSDEPSNASTIDINVEIEELISAFFLEQTYERTSLPTEGGSPP